MKPLLVYLFLINAAGLILMHMDKKKAKRKQWRIPEAFLLGIAIIGGSLGVLLGMRLFRHKTKKPDFATGVPLIFAIQVIATFIYLNV